MIEEVVFLGTGFSQPTAHRHAISMFWRGTGGLLVDAGGDPAKGLAKAGLLDRVDAVFITHRHTDHVGGLPLLVHALRFTQRARPLVVAALAPDVPHLQAACDGLDARAPYGLEWIALDPGGGRAELGGIVVETTPADHAVPALALRAGGVVYSSDTAPSRRITELARQADLLIHEATHSDEALVGRTKHSTPAQAGRIARDAGAAALALVHLHPSLEPLQARRDAAFEPTWVPQDGDRLVRKGLSWESSPDPSK